MTPHLSSDQISALTNGEYWPEAACHAADCPACADRVRQLTSSLELFRRSVAAVPSRAVVLPAGRVQRPPMLGWAAAAVVTVALSAAVFISQRQEQARQAEKVAREDAVLMEQLFQSTGRLIPASFERFNHVASAGRNRQQSAGPEGQQP